MRGGFGCATGNGAALHTGERRKARASGGSHADSGNSLMDKTSQSGCSCANEARIGPSLLREGFGLRAARRWRIPLKSSLSFLSLAILLGACGADAPKPAAQSETKPAAPPVPEEIQLAAA